MFSSVWAQLLLLRGNIGATSCTPHKGLQTCKLPKIPSNLFDAVILGWGTLLGLQDDQIPSPNKDKQVPEQFYWTASMPSVPRFITILNQASCESIPPVRAAWICPMTPHVCDRSAVSARTLLHRPCPCAVSQDISLHQPRARQSEQAFLPTRFTVLGQRSHVLRAGADAYCQQSQCIWPKLQSTEIADKKTGCHRETDGFPGSCGRRGGIVSLAKSLTRVT
eukprot:1985655-Amphidinium_carterae.1